MPHKILIVSKKSLGNIILQMGAIQALKEKHPTSQIFVACDERNASALLKHPDIADVIPLTLVGEKALGFFRLLKIIRKHRFDALLAFGHNSQACLWGFLTGITMRVGIKNQPLSFLLTHSLEEHDAELNSFEFYNKLASLVSPGLKTEFPTLTIDKQELQLLRNHLYRQKVARKFIIWHIGSSLEEKRYPIFQIVETLRLLRKNRVLLPILFAAGPGDEKFIGELEATIARSDIKAQKIFYADGIEFTETAALFSLAHIVICNDAAPRHIAAAIGKTSLSLMPQHRKHKWQVYGEAQNAYFLFSDVSAESLAVDTIEPTEIARMLRELL